MTLPVDDTDAVGSVHPAPLDASQATAAAAEVVTKAALSPSAVPHTSECGEQTRSPTVIEASMDTDGITIVTSSLLPPPPAPVMDTLSTTTSNVTMKQDEVRLSPVPSAAGTSTERCQLEDYTPFSKCHLWKLMMSFYDREGVESWAQGIVPHFITSNTFIAKRYSNVLRAYFRDVMRAASEHPVSSIVPLLEMD